MRQRRHIVATTILRLLLVVAVFVPQAPFSLRADSAVYAQTETAAPAAAPTLTVQAADATSVTATWTEVEGATGYELWRYESEWTQVGGDTLTGTSYTDSGLTAGQEYYYAVAAVNDGGRGPWSENVSVTLSPDTQQTPTPTQASTLDPTPTLTSTPFTLLAPELSVQAAGAASVTAAWTAVEGATGYELWRYDSEWTQVGGDTLTGTSYTDSGLTAGQKYYYAVAAVNAAGQGPWSENVSVTLSPDTQQTPTPTQASTLDPTPTLTSTPSPLLAPELSVQAAGAASVTAAWTAVEGATGYELWRYDSEWTQVGGALTGTSYTDSGLTAGQKYHYAVAAVNAAGQGPWSESVSVTLSPDTQQTPTPTATPTPALDPTPTSTPSPPATAPALTVQAADATSVTATWTEVEGATGYELWRYESEWTQVGGGTLTGTSYTDSGLTAGQEYYYAAAAVNDGGRGPWSENVPVTLSPDTQQTPTPTPTPTLTSTPSTLLAPELSVQAASIEHGARVAARDIDLGENDDPWGIWSDGTTMWVGDINVAKKLYAYSLASGGRVASRDIDTLRGAGNTGPVGLWSDGTTMWVADLGIDKLFAYNLASGARVASREFNLGNNDPVGIWSDGATVWVSDYGADKLYAYSLASGARVTSKDINTLRGAGNDHPAGLWSDGTTMWVVDGRDRKLYAYNLASGARVSSKEFDFAAGNERPEGLWSDGTTMWVADVQDGKLYAYSVVTDTGGPTGKPTLTAAAAGASAVELSWTAVANAAGYELQRWNGSTWVLLEGNLSGTSYTHRGLEAGTTYYYRVRALGAGDAKGPWSDWKQATTTGGGRPTGKPTLTAAAASSTSVTATWTAVAGATSYQLWRQHDSVWTRVGGTLTGTSYPDSGLTAETTYTYIVAAVNAAGRGPWSDTVRVTTPPRDDDDDDRQHGARVPSKDIDLLVGGNTDSNTAPTGLWSDGTTMWVLNFGGDVDAYNLASGARVASKDIGTGNTFTYGLWSDGTTIWVADIDDGKLYAYNLASGARVASKEFNLAAGNKKSVGLWSDGTTIWVLDFAGKLFAYNLFTNLASGARVASKEFNLAAGNDSPEGIWSDGTTMWVVDRDKKVYAYSLASGARVASKDFGLAAGNDRPTGLWSDGTTMWVADLSDDKLYAYSVTTDTTGPTTPPTGKATLTARAASSTSVRLTWTAVAGATSYDVQYWTAGLGNRWASLSTGKSGTTYDHSGLTAETTYYYTVAGVNAAGRGPWSDYVSATTPKNTGGGQLVRLTDNGAWDGSPAWSPDGGRIAFESTRDGNWEIYVMNADGTGVVRLTDDDAWDRSPAWSPDGGRIAFGSDRDGNQEIYVMNADGTGVVRLTDNRASDYNPAWSPDGGRIAFGSDRDGNWEIYVMNADGTGVVRLTNNTAVDYFPTWSPDGGRIAFGSDRDGNREIYVMNADGTGVVRLTDNEAWDGYPAWSPDGGRIAFDSDRDGNREIYVMNAAGTGVVRLTDNEAWDGSPAWSPDGGRIAFGSDRDGNWEIYVMNVAGAGGGPSTTDKAALVALYNATGGANWTNNNNWTSGRPLGEWHGVTTDSAGRVTRLDLVGNGLNGTLPSELGNLANLTYLRLGANRLRGSIPSSLGNLASLEYLYLQANQLSGTIPSELGNLTNLRYLYLSNNQLSGTIPSSLGNLTGLTHLTLYSNQLSGEIPPELGNLTGLKTLRIENNRLRGCVPAAWRDVATRNLGGLPFCSGLPAPTLTATAGFGEIVLTWTAVSGAAHYELWVAYYGASGHRIGGDLTDRTFTHRSLTPGTVYNYRVRAVDASGVKGRMTDDVSITPRPTKPTLVAAVESKTSVRLTWTAVSAASYDVWYWTAGLGNRWKSLSTGKPETTYEHTGLTAGKDYYYLVRGRNDSGAGPWSNRVKVTPDDESKIPPAGRPHLRAWIARDGSARIEWTDVFGAASYELERKDAGNWSHRDYLNGASYTDRTLASGTTYTYRVRARNAGGSGDWSNEARVRVGTTEPPGTSALSLQDMDMGGLLNDKGSFTISWTPAPRAASYDLIRCDNSFLYNVKYLYELFNILRAAHASAKIVHHGVKIAVHPDKAELATELLGHVAAYLGHSASDHIQDHRVREVSALSDGQIDGQRDELVITTGTVVVFAVKTFIIPWIVGQIVKGAVDLLPTCILEGGTVLQDTTGTTYTDDVERGENKWFYVVAKNEAGDGEKSELLHVRGGYLALYVTDLTDTSVSLKWTPYEGAAGFDVVQCAYSNDDHIYEMYVLRTLMNSKSYPLADLYFNPLARLGARFGRLPVENVINDDFCVVHEHSTGTYGATYDNLTTGKTYFYSLRSRSSGFLLSNFLLSNDVEVTPGAPFLAPTLNVTGKTTSSVRLAWASVPRADSYILFRSWEEGGTTLQKTVSLTATAYTDAGLQPGTEYTYSIRAYNAVGGPGPLSAVLPVTTDR